MGHSSHVGWDTHNSWCIQFEKNNNQLFPQQNDSELNFGVIIYIVPT